MKTFLFIKALKMQGPFRNQNHREEMQGPSRNQKPERKCKKFPLLETQRGNANLSLNQKHRE